MEEVLSAAAGGRPVFKTAVSYYNLRSGYVEPLYSFSTQVKLAPSVAHHVHVDSLLLVAVVVASPCAECNPDLLRVYQQGPSSAAVEDYR